jgi:hypothetical protein
MIRFDSHPTPQTAAPPQAQLVLHEGLRVQWTVRDGRLMSLWYREPHDQAEGAAA